MFSLQAEKVFMVARGLVREAREDLEGQQTKLKEVRDRLDRISRDDNQYLELATLEHRLLQVVLPHLDGDPGLQGVEGRGGHSDGSGGQRPGEEVNQKRAPVPSILSTPGELGPAV